MAPAQFKHALDRLDALLKLSGSNPVELRACGGGALALLGVSNRETRDIDVIQPVLPIGLIQLAHQVAKELALPMDWINNGPESRGRDLEDGWADRCHEIYQGSVLRVLILGRRDLIASKLFAFCDRDEADREDLLAINPTPSELASLWVWTLERDVSQLWPDRVRTRFAQLRRKLGHGLN